MRALAVATLNTLIADLAGLAATLYVEGKLTDLTGKVEDELVASGEMQPHERVTEPRAADIPPTGMRGGSSGVPRALRSSRSR